MLFSNIGILDKQLRYQPDCFVGVQKDKITYIGKNRPPGDYGEEYDGKGKLLMTGLINAHSHAPMTLLRGYAENMALQDWLIKKVFPFEDQMTPEDIYWGSMLAFAEMLRFGVISASEMYFMGEAMAKAAEDSSIRCNLSLAVTCMDDRDLCDIKAYKDTMALLPKLHNSSNGRLKMDVSLHAEYTSNPKIARQIADWAKETGLINQIHLSETKKEQDECIERHGKTPAAYFADLGLFDTPVV